MPNNFTVKATHALGFSQNAASGFGHTYIGSEHLLLALASESESGASKLLEARKITPEKLRRAISERIGQGEKTHLTAEDMTPRLRQIIENSVRYADSSTVGTEHLLLSLLNESDSIAIILLEELGTSQSELLCDTERYIGSMEIGFKENDKKLHRSAPVKLHDAPALTQYGRDMTALAREGKLDPIIGRDAETERVIQILSRRTKNNPCLIGEPGVGKTAVVEGLAERIASGSIPETLAGRCIIILDIPSMIAGAKYRGEFEERMKSVMNEVAKNRSVILFIDELHTLIGAGAAEGAVDAANILKPALARGELQMIGATTIEEFRAHIEKDAALERRFQPVTVGEPSAEEALEILRGLRRRYETHHHVRITDEALEAAVKLSVRYLGDRFLPDKAIDLIDEAASKKHISAFSSPELKRASERLRSLSADKEKAIRSQDFEGAARLRDEEKKLKLEETRLRADLSSTGMKLSIGEEDIADILTAWAGIPIKKLQNEESERLKELEELLKKRVIGQDEAVYAVAQSIRRSRVGLRDPARPIGSFLFIGPTGVGKTELAKALAETMFGDENSMIRIDMSEFMEKHSVSKLIGSPPGYVGYGDGGQLTAKVRQRPYSVVLFDEIEKAHSDVFDLLLQILEDGILTDSEGRKANFSNAVVIMTSNVGAKAILDPKPLGFTSSGGATLSDALKETFKPEFLNRIDEIITFKPLSQESKVKIVAAMLEKIKERIYTLGCEAEFSPELADWLASEGCDVQSGARPLRRMITRKLEDSFARGMLNGEFSSGDRLYALPENGEIIWKKTN